MADTPQVPDVARRLTVTPPELARLMGVPIPTVYKWAASGKIPSIRIGKRILIPVAQVRELLERCGSTREGGDAA